MTEKILSGVGWSVLNCIFWLQGQGVIPKYPWDIEKTGEEKLRGYDQGFGGDWHILEQEFIFKWDVLPDTLDDSPVRQPTTLTLLMRGEIPIGHGGKPMESKEAVRRWFIDRMRLEKPTGKVFGKVEEMTVLEAESKDNVINLLK